MFLHFVRGLRRAGACMVLAAPYLMPIFRLISQK